MCLWVELKAFALDDISKMVSSHCDCRLAWQRKGSLPPFFNAERTIVKQLEAVGFGPMEDRQNAGKKTASPYPSSFVTTEDLTNLFGWLQNDTRSSVFSQRRVNCSDPHSRTASDLRNEMLGIVTFGHHQLAITQGKLAAEAPADGNAQGCHSTLFLRPDMGR